METFRSTYKLAREGFRAAARHADARLARYGRTDLRGAQGEPLSVDVAILGPAQSERAAIVISGVHGGEAFAGSAVQASWLLSGAHLALPPDLRVVLVHGANPWGFSHMLRTTEANIDLNRNFRRTWPVPENRAYSQLAPYFQADRPDAGADLRVWRAYSAYLDECGWDIEGQAISGQSQDPQGVFFSGTGPDWANHTFRRILNDHLAGATKVGFIDFHTGVGEYGEVVHLIFAAPESDERAQTLAWWKLDGDGSSGFRAGSVPPYEGLLCGAIAQELPDARVAGSVMEFGTGDAFSVFRQDRLERWLRHEGRSEPNQGELRALCRDATTLRDPGWRHLVLTEGVARIDSLLKGLAGWNN